MKRLLLGSLFLLFSGILYAEVSSRLNITEQDGSPSVFPYKLKVTNGSLTDNGDGTASLATGGGSGSGGYAVEPATVTFELNQGVTITGNAGPTPLSLIDSAGNTQGFGAATVPSGLGSHSFTVSAVGSNLTGECPGAIAGDGCILTTRVSPSNTIRNSVLWLQGSLFTPTSGNAPPWLGVTSSGVVIQAGPIPMTGVAISTPLAPLQVGYGTLAPIMTVSSQSVITNYPGDTFFAAIDSVSAAQTYIGVQGGQSTIGTSSSSIVFKVGTGDSNMIFTKNNQSGYYVPASSTTNTVGQCSVWTTSSTLGSITCGTGGTGSGIISPSTFTWQTNFQLIVASTFTVTGASTTITAPMTVIGFNTRTIHSSSTVIEAAVKSSSTFVIKDTTGSPLLYVDNSPNKSTDAAWNVIASTAQGFGINMSTASTGQYFLQVSTSGATIWKGTDVPADSQALCLLGGHLGHCTSIVGAGGGCTCAVP